MDFIYRIEIGELISIDDVIFSGFVKVEFYNGGDYLEVESIIRMYVVYGVLDKKIN